MDSSSSKRMSSPGLRLTHVVDMATLPATKEKTIPCPILLQNDRTGMPSLHLIEITNNSFANPMAILRDFRKLSRLRLEIEVSRNPILNFLVLV